jgi:2-isopropylmalate synthase
VNAAAGYDDLVHSWGGPICPDSFRGVVDETIRDGLQMPYAPPLSTDVKRRLLDQMVATGISDVIIGMIQRDDTMAEVVALLQHCARPLQPWVLSRLHRADLERLVRLRDASGTDVGANVFVSLTPLRRLVEGWDEGELLEQLDEGLRFLRRAFSQVRVALEDATRTPPASMQAAARLVAEHGATRLVLADTAGVATPGSVARLFDFVHRQCPWIAAAGVALEWHGHNDRGLAVANTLEAIASGAHYAHGTMLGIGERNGNAALDTVLMNLSTEIGFIRWDALCAYQRECQQIFGDAFHGLYPFFGDYTFATATGTHCAAARKAILRGRSDLAVLLFSPPSVLSKAARPRFLLSPMSGRGAALAMLEEMGIVPTGALVDHLLATLRRLNRTIDAEELRQIVDTVGESTSLPRRHGP